jgi:cell division protein FtsL
MARGNTKGKQTDKKKCKKKTRATRERKGLTFGFLMMVLFILAGTGVFMVAMQQGAVSKDLAERRIEDKEAAEKAKQKSLRVEIARLQSPDRVMKIADDELNMTDPSTVIYLKYSRDHSGKVTCQSTTEYGSEPQSQTAGTQPSANEENSGNLTRR